MKRWIALLLALVMALGLTACGNQPAGDDGDADGSDDSVASRKPMAAPCMRPPYSLPATATFPAASRA